MATVYERVVDTDDVKERKIVQTGDFYGENGEIENIEDLYSGGGGGGGTSDHRDLSHRNDPNQHSISSITGLSTELDTIEADIEELKNEPLGNEESLFVDFGYQTDISQPSTGYVIRVNKAATNFKYNDRIRIEGTHKELVAKVMSITGGTMAFLTIDTEITPYGITMHQPVYLFKRTFTIDDAKSVLEATGQKFGTYDHSELENRDLDDQHPISAITDLQTIITSIDTSLNGKVDKVEGYGLSQANFTQAEKDKLASVDGPLWLGRYLNVSQLEAAHPANTAPDGARAIVDGGPDQQAKEYIIDRDEPMRWVPAAEQTGAETPASVLEKLLENPDTNILTDDEKYKLDNLIPTITVHNNLSGRSDIDTHPIQSITGLNDELDKKIEDAPKDGNLYGRINPLTGQGDPSWEKIVYPDAFPEAPIDGKNYLRNGSLKTWYSPVISDIEGLSDIIPSTASSSNKLADQQFVNSSVSNMASNRVTFDAAGSPFSTRADLLNALVVYNKGIPYTPTIHDYAIIISDEGAPSPYTNEQSRFEFDGSSWVYEYSYNTTHTAAEQAALSSGITSTLVSQITDNTNNITTINTNLDNKVDKVSGKELSTNDFTNAEKALLDSLSTLSEAPDDGKLYGRKNKNWSEVLVSANTFSDLIVSNWTLRTTPDNNWRSICWSPELRLFVAVADSGTGNRVMTSLDGINWTLRTTPIDNNWRAICWSPELMLFCAVSDTGTGNRVMTSPDGINWTLRTTPVDNMWRSICWCPELRLFVSLSIDGSTDGRVMTSPDGINWTIRTTPAIANQWYGICWSPELGLFVGVASVAASRTNTIMTSPDGINWVLCTTPATTVSWHSVTWSPELRLFVTIGVVGLANNRVMTSPDGINWTLGQSVGNVQWRGICWSSELRLFVAVGGEIGTGNRVMTSPDGINWTLRTTPVDNNWWAMCWSPELGLFAAVSYTGTGNRVMTSLFYKEGAL